MPALIIPSIFTAVDKLTAPVRAMGRNISKDFANKAQSGLAAVDNFSKKLIPGLGEASKQFLSFASAAAVTAAIISGITFSLGAIKDYDKALGSLQAVTGLTGAQFAPFKSKIIEVASATKVSAIDTAKAFELIGSANSKLLESADAMGAVTKSAIILSQASGDDLATSAASLVGVMNQFNLEAAEADRTMNVLAAGAKVGAATIPQVAEAMKNFGSVAASANLSVEESVALVEVLSQKSVFGAEAGTKLRGSLLAMQKAGLGYASGQFKMNDAMNQANKNISKLKTAKEKDAYITKLFGAENVSTGKILLSNVGLFNEFTKGVTDTGEAVTQAAIKNDTLDASINQLKAAWVTMLVGSAGAAKGVDKVKNAVQFLTNNLGNVVYYTGLAIASFIAFRTTILVARGAMFLYNVALGVYTAWATRTLVMTNANTVAQKAFFIASRIGVIWLNAVAAAQWLWNAAMTANPIGLIIVAIFALGAAVAYIIYKWNEFGDAILLITSLIFPPLGVLISLVDSFSRNWNMITAAFKDGGIIEGLKAIGFTILDAILSPLEKVLGVIASLTGADWASKMAADISKFRSDQGLAANVVKAPATQPAPAVSGPPSAPNMSVSDLAASAMNSVGDVLGTNADISSPAGASEQKIVIEINDNTGSAKITSNNSSVPVVLKSTSKRP